MAESTENLAFTWDNADMLGAVNEVIKSFQRMDQVMSQTADHGTEKTKKFENQTEQSGKSGEKAGFLASAGFAKLLGVVGLVTAGFAAVKGAFMALPEVGRTFEFVGRVFITNFLQPLREMLIPMLNRLTAWVSNNRGLFVQWGATLANIFRVAIGVFSMLWKMIEVVAQNIAKSLEGVFGGFTGSLQDVIDTIITKIAATIIFAMVLLEPVFALIGRIIGFLVAGISGLFSGFMQGAAGITTVLEGIIGVVVDIFDGIMEAFGGAKGFFSIMERVGRILGAIFKFLLEALKVALEFLKPVLVFIAEQMVGAVVLFLDIVESIPDIFNSAVRGVSSGINWISNAFKAVGNFVDKWIIQPVAGAFNWLQNTISKAFNWILSKLEAVWGTISETLGDVADFFGFGDDKKTPAAGQPGAAAAGGTPANVGGRSQVNNNNNVSAPVNVTVNGGDPAKVQAAVRNGVQGGINGALRKSINKSAEANGF